MKILMTADTIGGVWTYSIELARALGSFGVEVELATMGALPTSEQLSQAWDISNLRIYPSDFRLEWMDDPWEDVGQAGRWLLRLEERLKPDIVHLNGYVHGSLPWHAPVLIVGHSCVLSWWEAVKGESAPSQWNTYSHLVANGLHSASMVITPTRAMLKALERHYGALNRAGVVPNCRDAGLFLPDKKEPFVFTAGRIWDEAKNIALLAAASGALPWTVYVAGDDGGREEAVPAHGGVHMLGRVAPQAIPFWLSRASIYVLPARYEPFGLSILEAALAGCALVLGDIPSLREVWDDNAVFVPPDNLNALADAINGLISDYPLRASYAVKARTHALGYTPERTAKGYMDVYKSLLPSRSSVAASSPNDDGRCRES